MWWFIIIVGGATTSWWIYTLIIRRAYGYNRYSRHWNNFSGNLRVHGKPMRYLENVSQVIEFMRECHDQQKRVVVVGGSHSWAEFVSDSADYLVRLVGALDTCHMLEDGIHVDVGGGCSVEDMMVLMSNHGRTLHELPIAEDVTLAGVISTGVHGSGTLYGLISHRMIACTVILAGGRPLALNNQDTPDLMRVFRCALGQGGIIVRMVLSTVASEPSVRVTRPIDSFFDLLRVVKDIEKFNDALGNVETDLDGIPVHDETFWSLHLGRGYHRQVRQSLDKKKTLDRQFGALANQMRLTWTQVLVQGIPRALRDLLARNLSDYHVSWLATQLYVAWAFPDVVSHAQSSYRLWMYPNHLSYLEMEVAIPAHHVEDVLKRLQKVWNEDDERRLSILNTFVYLRWITIPDENPVLLGPPGQPGDRWCYLSFTSTRMERMHAVKEAFYVIEEAVFQASQVYYIPHWAKLSGEHPDTPLHPYLNTFKEQLPEGNDVFRNPRAVSALKL